MGQQHDPRRTLRNLQVVRLVSHGYQAMQEMWLHNAAQSKTGFGHLPIKEMAMTQYNVEKIENGIATVRYADGSWAELILSADMTQEDVDDLAFQFARKEGVAPSFLSVGATSTASAKPEPVDDTPTPDWLIARVGAYGNAESQLEYITENGLDAWQAHVAEIKAANPKPAE